MRQLIVVRKDLQMTHGKMAAQVAHASWGFASRNIKKYIEHGKIVYGIPIDEDIYNGWFNDIFTKTICEAKNKNQLLKAKTIAEELGLVEDKDFVLVYDACRTELTPEESDGTTLTCIGFKPLDDEIAHKISKKFQLYK